MPCNRRLHKVVEAYCTRTFKRYAISSGILGNLLLQMLDLPLGLPDLPLRLLISVLQLLVILLRLLIVLSQLQIVLLQLPDALLQLLNALLQLLGLVVCTVSPGSVSQGRVPQSLMLGLGLT